jgi:cytochrome c5
VKRPATLALSLACAGVLACAAALAARPNPALAQVSGPSPPAAGAADKGKAAYDQACVSCHDSSVVEMAHKTRDDWKQTVDQMRAMGAAVDDEQAGAIVDYLARTYPP